MHPNVKQTHCGAHQKLNAPPYVFCERQIWTELSARFLLTQSLKSKHILLITPNRKQIARLSLIRADGCFPCHRSIMELIWIKREFGFGKGQTKHSASCVGTCGHVTINILNFMPRYMIQGTNLIRLMTAEYMANTLSILILLSILVINSNVI